MFGLGKTEASKAAPEIAATGLLACADTTEDLDDGVVAGAVVSAMVYDQAISVGVKPAALAYFTEATFRAAMGRNLLISSKFTLFAVLCAKAIEISKSEPDDGLQDEFWQKFGKNLKRLDYGRYLALTGLTGACATAEVRSNFSKWDLKR